MQIAAEIYQSARQGGKLCKGTQLKIASEKKMLLKGSWSADQKVTECFSMESNRLRDSLYNVHAIGIYTIDIYRYMNSRYINLSGLLVSNTKELENIGYT